MRKYCSKCREWKNTDGIFCTKCGTELQGASKFASRETLQSESPETTSALYGTSDTNVSDQSKNIPPDPPTDKNAANTDIPSTDPKQVSAQIEQLKADVGISIECSYEKSSKYERMLKNGEQIPSNIERLSGNFYRKDAIPPDQQQLYLMMRISKDLHFIRVVLQVSIILAVIAAVLIPIIMNMGN